MRIYLYLDTLARYDKLLLDAQKKTYRVLAAFETPDLDLAYDVAEGAV